MGGGSSPSLPTNPEGDIDPLKDMAPPTLPAGINNNSPNQSTSPTVGSSPGTGGVNISGGIGMPTSGPVSKTPPNVGPAPAGKEFGGLNDDGSVKWVDTEQAVSEAADKAAKDEELKRIQEDTAAIIRTTLEASRRDRQRRQAVDSKAISILSTLITGPLGLTEKAPGAGKSLLGQ